MTKLILLALLNEQDMYGYEINNILREKYSHFTRVSFSSIYYTLDRLEENGLITKREEKVGNRPARHIYHITPVGRKEFENILTKAIKKESTRINQQEPFNLPFSLMGRLPVDEATKVLEKRLELVVEEIVAHKDIYVGLTGLHSKKENPQIDLFLLLLVRRGIIHMEAEERWLKECLETIAKETKEEKKQTINEKKQTKEETKED